jgi:hypothetical protein
MSIFASMDGVKLVKELRTILKCSINNVIVALFPDARIDCCSFHLGQAWWRNIQRIGLSSEYKDKSGEIGKWLSKFVGLA